MTSESGEGEGREDKRRREQSWENIPLIPP